MIRRLGVALIATTLLGVTACGSSGSHESGFRLSGSQVEPPATAPPSDASSWTTIIATAKPDVSEVLAACRPPAEVLQTAKKKASAQTANETSSTASTTTTAPSGDNANPPDAQPCPVPPPPPGKPELSPIPSDVPNAVSAQAPGGWTFKNPTFYGNPLVFRVLQDHGDWLQVELPVRPNGQKGWIHRSDVTISSTRWHVRIRYSTNQLWAWNGNKLEMSTKIVDGRPNSPTPLGNFYFNEKIKKWPASDYGSWIFSTNGFSDTLETFGGGLPVFAVHGTSHPEQVGSKISNGCVRIPNAIIEKMAAEVPMGTPVQVVA